MSLEKPVIADLHYTSSTHERYYTDLNERVEAALKVRVGARYQGMDGGSFVGRDAHDPTASDNIPMVEVLSSAEAEELGVVVEAIVKRPVTVTLHE